MDTSNPKTQKILSRLALAETLVVLCVLGGLVSIVVGFLFIRALASGPGSEAIIVLPIGRALVWLLIPAAGVIAGLVWRAHLKGRLAGMEARHE